MRNLELALIFIWMVVSMIVVTYKALSIRPKKIGRLIAIILNLGFVMLLITILIHNLMVGG